MECVSALLAPPDLHFQKKLKLIEDKCEIPNRCKHDEKSGTILEEKGDVPVWDIAQFNMSDILEKLSAKYRVSKRALCTDWQKRTQWVYDVFDLEPARTS